MGLKNKVLLVAWLEVVHQSETQKTNLPTATAECLVCEKQIGSMEISQYGTIAWR